MAGGGALCSRVCGVGFYCDSGTTYCETCESICNPLRNTLDECLNTLPCQDYWPLSQTASSLVDPTSSTGVISESSKVILYSVTIVGSIVALFLIVALIFRLMRRNSAFKCWKPFKPQTTPPVQLSLTEQRRTKDMADGGNPYVGLLLSPDGDDLIIGQRIETV